MDALAENADRYCAMSERTDEWPRILELIEWLNREAIGAKIENRPAKFECDYMTAFYLGFALQDYADRKAPLIRAMYDIEENIIKASRLADETMRDEATRFALAVADLELTLEHFVGRRPATFEEIREARSRMASGPRNDRKPASTPVPISDELARSIRTGRVGDPREPGSEG